MWQIVAYYSDDVILRNLRILAPQHSPNTDAIDPFASSNVIIDHVFSDVGDDNAAIKSGPINSPGPDSPSRNITITDCTFLHGHWTFRGQRTGRWRAEHPRRADSL